MADVGGRGGGPSGESGLKGAVPHRPVDDHGGTPALAASVYIWEYYYDCLEKKLGSVIGTIFFVPMIGRLFDSCLVGGLIGSSGGAGGRDPWAARARHLPTGK